MQTAVENGVDEIVGDCGGAMMCATCHVFVDESWADRLNERKPGEASMLDGTAVPSNERSRLSCQIFLSDDLDGLIVHTPATQE